MFILFFNIRTLAFERTVLTGSVVYVRICRYGIVIFDNYDTADPESTDITAIIAIRFNKRNNSFQDYDSNLSQTFRYHLIFGPVDTVGRLQFNVNKDCTHSCQNRFST